MGWLTKVIVLVVFQYISLCIGMPPLFPFADHINEIDTESNEQENYFRLENDADHNLVDDDKLAQIGEYLAEILAQPASAKGLPILYIEEKPPNEEFEEPPLKRSRYYRRYPWKRQNSRQTYDVENRYLCQPNKDDVFRLLVALHESRRGNKGRHINFCNRKRPATAIFTNIRFLG